MQTERRLVKGNLRSGMSRPVAYLAYQIQSDSHCPAIAFPKRMRHIHLHILFYNFIKSCLRHLFNIFKRLFQISNGDKPKIPFCKIDLSYFTRKIVNILPVI